MAVLPIRTLDVITACGTLCIGQYCTTLCNVIVPAFVGAGEGVPEGPRALEKEQKKWQVKVRRIHHSSIILKLTTKELRMFQGNVRENSANKGSRRRERLVCSADKMQPLMIVEKLECVAESHIALLVMQKVHRRTAPRTGIAQTTQSLYSPTSVGNF